MSIPLVFQPFHVATLPESPQWGKSWRDVKYNAEQGGKPTEVCDAGLVFSMTREASTPLLPASDDRCIATSTPVQIYFQDGGLLSNFPMSLFHVSAREEVSCPTFGVSLSPIRALQEVSSLTSLLQADIMTAKNSMDYEFVLENEVCTGMALERGD